MDDQQWLAERFEEHRTRLRAVAYRMLGLAQRGRRRRPGRLAAGEPRRRQRRREPRRVADHGRRARLAEHAALAQHAARGSRWTCTCPTRSSIRPTGPTPSTRRCSPTRSAWPCWSCSRRSRRRSGSRSSCTTCSVCRSSEIAPIVERSPDAARQLASRARRRVRGRRPDARRRSERAVGGGRGVPGRRPRRGLRRARRGARPRRGAPRRRRRHARALGPRPRRRERGRPGQDLVAGRAHDAPRPWSTARRDSCRCATGGRSRWRR